jgi:hypothetical protein
LMVGINGAMFIGGFGFVPAGAAATFGGRIAVDLLEERFSAIGNAAADDAHGALLADGGAALPAGVIAPQADAPKLRDKESGKCSGQRSHDPIIGHPGAGAEAGESGPFCLEAVLMRY